MSIKKNSKYGSSGTSLDREDTKLRAQSDTRIEKIILDFINNSPKFPKRRYIIARNQILSLYKRMNYHPEKITLCKFYENRIKQIIQLEKGKEK